MTATGQALDAITANRRKRLARTAEGALAVLLALWLVLFAGLTSASAAATRCPGFSPHSTGRTSALALVLLSEAEGEEDEEEPEGQAEGERELAGNEDAASAEAEAEEEPTAANGSPSVRSRDTSSVVLSHLRLTAQAKAALEQHQPAASYVGFSFALSAPAKVQLTLVRQTSSHGHRRWTMLDDSLTLSARRGRTAQSLKGHNRLPFGRYRLTAKPAGGRARSIYLNA